jgi:S-adenosylmethionine decarboxylase
MRGIHLIIDGFKCNKERLNDKALILAILDQLPEQIGMKKLSKAVVVKGRGKPGWTGFVLIETSHISIHTFTRENYIAIDIFSCKKFNSKQLIDFFKETFEIKKMKKWVIKRSSP